MRKFFYFVIILLILAGGYYFYAAKNRQAVAPTVDDRQIEQKEDAGGQTPSQSQPSATSGSATSPQSSLTASSSLIQENNKAAGTFSSGEDDAMAPDILVVQVDYDGTAYNPSAVDIKVGDIVIFRNNSNGQMWPASAPHPTHTNYPEFDAKQGIEAGGKWQFKFERTGLWFFHDHLNPSARGTINVGAR